jgi:hypothetical protein
LIPAPGPLREKPRVGRGFFGFGGWE